MKDKLPRLIISIKNCLLIYWKDISWVDTMDNIPLIHDLIIIRIPICSYLTQFLGRFKNIYYADQLISEGYSLLPVPVLRLVTLERLLI